MFTLKSEPKNIKSILSDGFELYRVSFWHSLPYALLATCFLALPHLATALPFAITESQTATIAMLFATYGIGLWILSACVIQINSQCNQTPCGFGHAFKIASLKWFPLLLLLIIFSVIILASTMLLIIPGLIFLYILSFGTILLLTQHQTLWQALVMSAKLVEGQWWHTFLGLTIPILACTTALLWIFYAIAQLLTHNIVSENNLLIHIPQWIVQILFIPYIIAITIVLLHDLKTRHHAKRPSWS